MTMLNRDASQLLSHVGVELSRIAETWQADTTQADAVAAAHALQRITEAVRDAVQLRPLDNPVSPVTATNLDAIAVALEKASKAATAPDLAQSIVGVAEHLRREARRELGH